MSRHQGCGTKSLRGNRISFSPEKPNRSSTSTSTIPLNFGIPILIIVYLVNSTLAIKEKREAIELAVVRDELIEKPLAIRQLFYCVTAARQRLLAIPSKVGNHFGTREVPVREVVDYLRGEVNAALSELARLPEAVEANWQERLEED